MNSLCYTNQMVIDKVVPISSSMIKNEEGKILLLQRSQIASYPDYWQLVEGKLEDGESPIQAITREIKEEIGCLTSKVELKRIFYNELQAKGQNYLAFRVVFTVEIESNKINLSKEHKAFGWYTKVQALALPLLPGVKEVLEKMP